MEQNASRRSFFALPLRRLVQQQCRMGQCPVRVAGGCGRSIAAPAGPATIAPWTGAHSLGTQGAEAASTRQERRRAPVPTPTERAVFVAGAASARTVRPGGSSKLVVPMMKLMPATSVRRDGVAMPGLSCVLATRKLPRLWGKTWGTMVAARRPRAPLAKATATMTSTAWVR